MQHERKIPHPASSMQIDQAITIEPLKMSFFSLQFQSEREGGCGSRFYLPDVFSFAPFVRGLFGFCAFLSLLFSMVEEEGEMEEQRGFEAVVVEGWSSQEGHDSVYPPKPGGPCHPSKGENSALTHLHKSTRPPLSSTSAENSAIFL